MPNSHRSILTLTAETFRVEHDDLRNNVTVSVMCISGTFYAKLQEVELTATGKTKEEACDNLVKLMASVSQLLRPARLPR